VREHVAAARRQLACWDLPIGDDRVALRVQLRGTAAAAAATTATTTTTITATTTTTATTTLIFLVPEIEGVIRHHIAPHQLHQQPCDRG
jgi:hypothetical protein